MNFHARDNIPRQFSHIATIILRQNDLHNLGTSGSNQFFTYAADRQYQPGQSKLPCHCQRSLDPLFPGQRQQCRRHGNASAGPILGCRTFWHMQMNEGTIEIVCSQPIHFRSGSYITVGDFSGLLHDIAKLTRQFEATLFGMHLGHFQA